MLKTVHKIITGLIISLGSLHILVTFVDYDEFSLRALWFASAGAAIILSGFLNLILLRDSGRDRVVWLLCLFTNVVFVAMFCSALYLMQQPQVFLGVALFASATIVALFRADVASISTLRPSETSIPLIGPGVKPSAKQPACNASRIA